MLCTLKAWEDPEFCKERLGRDEPLGSIDRAKLNVNGGSLAAGHPFAATGGRIVAGLAKQLHEDGKGRGVISICAAGGQGVVAILESAGRRRNERPLRAARQRARSLGTLAKQLGLPQPVELDRYQAGRSRSSPARSSPAPRPDGRLEQAARRRSSTSIGAERAGAEGKAKALVFDATGIADSTELVELQRFFYPAVGRLQRSGRVVVLGTPPARGRLGPRPHTAQRALEGFTRSLGKEIGGRGATAQLVYVAPGAEDQLDSTLRFLLSPRSAYVSGQVVRVGKGVAAAARDRLGAAARRQGRRWSPAPRAGSARRSPTTLARDGAERRRPRRPAGRRATCRRSTDALGGRRDRARHHRRRTRRSGSPTRFADGVDVVVHNAGVTSDRTIAKMPEERWAQLMEINLSSEERINDALLDARACCAPTGASSASPRWRGSPATRARPTTPPRRPA